jgi:Methyltransferase domain
MEKYSTKFEDLQKVSVRSDIAKLLTAINAEKICEIGVREGEHLVNLLVPCVKEAYAVDVWRETGVRSQNDNCYEQEELEKQYNKIVDLSTKDTRVKIVRELSVDASAKFDDGFFDFVYIDADHTEAAVWADINAWWSKVRVGGILSGHDYSAAIPTTKDNVVLKFGVIEAVNKFVKEKNLKLHTDHEQSWFLVKC